MNYDIFSGFSAEQLKAIRNDLDNLRKSLNSRDLRLIDALKGFSMLPPSRLLDACRTSRQSTFRNPDAAIVEFGVYRGGALAAMAYGASLNRNFNGVVIGFDTFEGHTHPPHDSEVDIHGTPQRPVYEEKIRTNEAWASCDMQTVLNNYSEISEFLGVNLPQPNLVKGDAQYTAKSLHRCCPGGISLLRLDMDWYEPTRAALTAATPLLCENGVIIADDYGHHSGVRTAIDEWLATLKIRYDCTMTDYSCMRIILL